MIRINALIMFVILGLTPAALKADNCQATAKNTSVKMTAPSSPDIVDVAVKSDNFKTLVAALKAAGLVDALKSEGKFTVFAPTDAAFAKLPEGTIANLLKPENKDALVNILTYHVVKGEVPFKAAVGLSDATALNKQKINIKLEKGALYLNESRVINNDIQTSNGIIHVIDTVLIPPAIMSEKLPAAKQVIYSAIDKGVPLFNMGQHRACADIYELAAESLLLMDEKKIDNDARKVLKAGLNTAKKSSSDAKRAWAMRHALDEVVKLMN